MALVSTIAVLRRLAVQSATSSVDSAITADYMITGGSGVQQLGRPGRRRVPGVAAVSIVYRGQFEFRGSLSSLAGVTPAHLPETVNLTIIAGTGLGALAAGELLIDTTTANSDHLSVGSVVPGDVRADGASTMRIGGIFKPNPLSAATSSVTASSSPTSTIRCRSAVLIRERPGATHVEAAINPALHAYPNLTSRPAPSSSKSQQHSVNAAARPGLCPARTGRVIALIGIVNTLMLSVFERTHELGLLRAVGMRRRQVRAMIRSESVIIALFGAVIGVIIGTGLGVAFAHRSSSRASPNLVPFARLAVFLVLSACSASAPPPGPRDGQRGWTCWPRSRPSDGDGEFGPEVVLARDVAGSSASEED